MNRLLQGLAKLDPRIALLILCTIGALAVFESWVVLRTPLAELRSLTATRERLRSTVARDLGSRGEIERLQRELDAAAAALAGGLVGSDDAMVPLLITTLDTIAVRHGVSLGGVKPPTRRPLGSFEELAFGVEARGDYRAVFAWLRDTLQQVAPLLAVEYSIKSIDEGQRVSLAVKLAAYRVPAAAAGPAATK